MGKASLLVKARGATVFAVKVRNRDTAAHYVLLIDAKTVPADATLAMIADGGTVVDLFQLAASGTLYLDADYFSSEGIKTTDGLVVVVSTNDSLTKALATDANHDIAVTFD